MMDPSDQEKTAFITKKGLYCYKIMSFGLKNVGATYQRLVNKVFTDKIDRSMEVYVDDMLVKSPTIEQHIKDLTDTFASLRLYNMRLNSEKCTFGVGSVQICEVDTHSPFPASFFHHDHIGKPVRVMYFPDEVGLLKLGSFLPHCC